MARRVTTGGFPRISVFVLLAIAGLAAGCANASDGGRGAAAATPVIPVTLGVVQSETGAGAVYGLNVEKGIQLAVNQINESGRLAISVKALDDKSTVDGGNAAFAALGAENVTAIIGPTLSTVAIEAHKIAQAAGIPAIGATNTAEGITATGDYIFRVSLTEAVVVPVAIEYVHRTTPVRSALLFLDSTDAFSRSSAVAMRRGIAAIGGTISAEVDIAGETNIAAKVPPPDGVQADALLITPLADKSAQLVQAVRAAGYRQPIVGGNGLNTLDIARTAGAAVEGVIVGAAWNPALDTPLSRQFVAAYQKEYGVAPDLFAAQGYTAVYVLADAVARARSTEHKAVRDSLARTSGLETVLGTLSINEQRDAVHPAVVQRFTGGQLQVVR